MTKINSDNTSLAAYRVFETLKFLIKQPASVTDIMKYLSNLENNQKAFSKAVIYKYLATLKFAGINIRRHKCKYEVVNLPFKIPFSKDNLELLHIIKQLIDITPETHISEKIRELFYQLEMRYSLETHYNSINSRNILNRIIREQPDTEQKKIIKQYEKFCKDKIKIHVKYINLFGENISTVCEPLDVKYENNNIWFTLQTERPNEIIELNSKQIKEIFQTPSKCTGQNRFTNTTTIFKLKERLALRYTLRNEEAIISSNSNEKVISNSLEPKEKLYLRLMRYSYLCEALNPKADRIKMKTLIEKTLSNYNE